MPWGVPFVVVLHNYIWPNFLLNLSSVLVKFDSSSISNTSTVNPIQTYQSLHADMPVFRPRTNVPHSFPERPARQLRGMALRPISLNAGTPYPCTAGELRDAINPNRHSRRSSDFIIADQASYEVYAQNARGRNLGRGEYNAMCRLEECIVAVFRDRLDWTPDLIIKAFCDLDRVFFCGRLRGYVRVRWVPGSYFPAQRRTAFGYTEILGGGKAEIVLNADGIFSRTLPLSGFLEMFRTMLHEMW